MTVCVSECSVFVSVKVCVCVCVYIGTEYNWKCVNNVN